MKNLKSLALIAAVLGSVGGMAGANVIRAEPSVRRYQSAPLRTADSTPPGRGPGWTNAHARRVALKLRNVKRHRAVMKRAK